MNCKTLLLSIAVGMAILIAGCGGGTPISIAITTPPPASLNVNQTVSIVATVANDPSESGVTWTCTPAGSCGSFNPAQTASGSMTAYTAPGAPGTVTLIAASTKNPTKTQSASVTINSLPLSITITAPPPMSLEVNLTASIAATVANDPSNAGVDWSCTPTGTCGTFTPAHTASGATTVYMAPRTSGPVTITATSTAEPAQFKQASVTINPVATVGDLTGTYTFFVNGFNSFEFPYSVAGSVVLGGAQITGEQDEFSCPPPPAVCSVFPLDPIAKGSISVGSDGRGTLSLTPTSAPPETFSITVVNNKHILITQFDTNATASGSLDLQTAPTSVPSGGNAFALSDPYDEYVLGGVLTSSGASVTAITASEADDDIGGAAHFGFALTCPVCTITAPDAAGRGTITLTDPNVGSMELAYYVVGSEAFRLIEFDKAAFLSGSMYGQGSGTFSPSTLAKPFAFAQSGIGSSTGTGIGVWAAAGQFTGNGTTLSAGVADVNQGDGMPVKAGALSTSPYSVKANGYGAITLSGANTDGLANFGIYLVDPAMNVADPNNPSGGGGGVMLDLDVDTIGVGFAVPQTLGASFSGNYALQQQGAFVTSTAAAFYGLVGQIFASTTTFTGLADYNELTIAQNAGVTITGNNTLDMANPGRATSQVTINNAATPNNITAYQASGALLLDVDVDSTGAGLGNVALGVIEQQQ